MSVGSRTAACHIRCDNGQAYGLRRSGTGLGFGKRILEGEHVAMDRGAFRDDTLGATDGGRAAVLQVDGAATAGYPCHAPAEPMDRGLRPLPRHAPGGSKAVRNQAPVLRVPSPRYDDQTVPVPDISRPLSDRPGHDGYRTMCLFQLSVPGGPGGAHPHPGARRRLVVQRRRPSHRRLHPRQQRWSPRWICLLHLRGSRHRRIRLVPVCRRRRLSWEW